ncbi:hypothetical protein Daus18300_009316 [Diaporthe australafricana]|uniref:F-box domain-containing protein n=1 Tax=Diaporthe australafricana TaxID=127596 RepID=A0ABR3WET1_9PEZI
MEASIATRARVSTGQVHAQDEEITSVAVAPILRLHPSLRHRIYLLTRIVARFENDRHAVLNLNGENPVPSFWQYNLEYMPGFHGLLLCCRTIYAEASALLYSSNSFIIRYWEKETLSPLRNLTPSAVSNLRYLKIVLNQSSCHRRDPGSFEDNRGVCDDEQRESESKKALKSELYNAPLDIREPRAKVLLDEWHSVAEHLSRHISPQNLELCIVCDVGHDDLEAARSAVRPMSLFPELRNCHIRLSRSPNPQLRRMAQDSVLKARRILGPPSSGNIIRPAQPSEGGQVSQSGPQVDSRLLTLPRELRFRILSYTDLMTPWQEVEWSRQSNHSGKYVALYPWCGISKGELTLDNLGMQVSRTLLQDARVVFFSGNRFVVHDFRVFSPWSTPDDSKGDNGTGRTEFAKYHSERLAASIFLREVVPLQMLREIRELEFVFPPYSHTGWPEEGHRALADWADTLAWARGKMNLGGLTLRLVMADSLNGEEPPPGREGITSEQVEDILSAYRRIASPLSVLARAGANDTGGCDGDADELRSFHAQVAWPWEWNWGHDDKLIEYGCQWVREYRRDRYRELDQEAEKLIMGQRSNEYCVSNRASQRKSTWEDRFHWGIT